jgi:hypothetical protein
MAETSHDRRSVSGSRLVARFSRTELDWLVGMMGVFRCSRRAAYMASLLENPICHLVQ